MKETRASSNSERKLSTISISSEQLEVNMLGLGPLSEHRGSASREQLDAVFRLLAAGAELVLRDLPSDQLETLKRALADGQSIKVGAVKYTRINKRSILTDYLDTYGIDYRMSSPSYSDFYGEESAGSYA